MVSSALAGVWACQTASNPAFDRFRRIHISSSGAALPKMTIDLLSTSPWRKKRPTDGRFFNSTCYRCCQARAFGI